MNILLGLQACLDYPFTMVQVSHVVLVSSKFDMCGMSLLWQSGGISLCFLIYNVLRNIG